MHHTEIIILAAGKGTRMGGDIPKALTKLKGKTFLRHLIESVKKVFAHQKPIVVIGHKKELVIEELGPDSRYAHQDEQLGTGHAVLTAKDLASQNADSVMVLYADHPLVSPKTIEAISKKHQEEKPILTMATVTMPEGSGWHTEAFSGFGRIIRDKDGNIERIVEKKDATPEEFASREVNPAYFCFNAEWLWSELANLKNENAQREYYLTDLVQRAFDSGAKIATISIDPIEGLGANTQEQLALLEQFVKEN